LQESSATKAVKGELHHLINIYKRDDESVKHADDNRELKYGLTFLKLTDDSKIQTPFCFGRRVFVV
jgi:hypothetical protein